MGRRDSSVGANTPSSELPQIPVVQARIRHIGARRIQTIKTIHKGGRGPLGRDEWEDEVDTDTPSLSLAKGTALAPFAGKRLRRELRPMFETVVERQTVPVHSGASDIEVAIDRGWVKAGRNRDLINELELELKNGNLTDLIQIAERLAGPFPLAYAPDRNRIAAMPSLLAGKPVRLARPRSHSPPVRRPVRRFASSRWPAWIMHWPTRARCARGTRRECIRCESVCAVSARRCRYSGR